MDGRGWRGVGDGLAMVSRVSLSMKGGLEAATTVVLYWLGLLCVEQNVAGSNRIFFL